MSIDYTKFSLVITAAPMTCSAQAALFFAQAALQSGHSLSQIFFQGDGVYCCNQLLTPLSDELNIQQAWINLQQQYKNIKLHVCIASALKRGMLDTTQAKDNQHQQHTVQKPFELVGLGQLATAYRQNDKVIYFGQ